MPTLIGRLEAEVTLGVYWSMAVGEKWFVLFLLPCSLQVECLRTISRHDPRVHSCDLVHVTLCEAGTGRSPSIRRIQALSRAGKQALVSWEISHAEMSSLGSAEQLVGEVSLRRDAVSWMVHVADACAKSISFDRVISHALWGAVRSSRDIRARSAGAAAHHIA